MAFLRVLPLLCLLVSSTHAAFQGLCGMGTSSGRTQQCYDGNVCPQDSTLVGTQFNLCYDRQRRVGGICCENNNVRVTPDERCGRVSVLNARIGNGEDAPRCSAPWQVSIRARTNKDQPLSKSNSIHWCGGTLIDDQHVLTTPLCLFSAGVVNTVNNIVNDVMVVAGDWDHTRDDYYNGIASEQDFFIEDWRLHPGYPNVTSLADINDIFANSGEAGFHANGFVIVTLTRPIAYTDCVRPACLTSQANDMESSPCGLVNCKMTGWGHTEKGELRDYLQQAHLNMPNKETCEAIEYYGAGMLNMPANTTCAVSLARPRAFNCVGDQGGPVVCQGQDGRWTLRGAVLARLLCDSGAPVPVADVTGVMDWVNSVIGS